LHITNWILMEKADIHFTKRAEKYNRSSNWVSDRELINKIFALSEAKADSVVLDLATGTGLIAERFKGNVKKVIGLDINREMVKHAQEHVDEFVFAPMEKIPFQDNTFDVCVCRQGLQFAELDKVIPEIHRVLKPGGVTVLCHLTAYNEIDKELTFHIQKLRNPARRNFLMPGDILNLLSEHGFREAENIEYITDEPVNQWIDNGAISAENMEQIKAAYRSSNEDFRLIHKIRFETDDIIDAMLLVIAKARK
jgi:ubiquinone/menaquinone biosynthesis C-methylase UbiE